MTLVCVFAGSDIWLTPAGWRLAACRCAVYRYLTRTCKNCPITQLPLGTVTLDTSVDAMEGLNKTRVHCINKRYGCTHVGNFADYSLHASTCSNMPSIDESCGLVTSHRSIDTKRR